MVTSKTSPEDLEATLVDAIAARHGGTSRDASVRKLGERSNNTNYLAVGGDERLVVKLSKPQREK